MFRSIPHLTALSSDPDCTFSDQQHILSLSSPSSFQRSLTFLVQVGHLILSLIQTISPCILPTEFISPILLTLWGSGIRSLLLLTLGHVIHFPAPSFHSEHCCVSSVVTFDIPCSSKPSGTLTLQGSRTSHPQWRSHLVDAQPTLPPAFFPPF